ncbi:MAG: ECF-type sigma factor [Acidobacteriota bacterium]
MPADSVLDLSLSPRTSAFVGCRRDVDGASDPAVVEQTYDELRRLARRYLRGERPGHTLQATELVHEALTRLWGGGAVDWRGRAHFVGRTARIMRSVLVDHARARQRLKRGGDRLRVTFDEPTLRVGSAPHGVDLLDLDAALDQLGELDATKADLVDLRFFAGATIEEAAEMLGLSRTVAVRQWRMTRAWLHRRLQAEP